LAKPEPYGLWLHCFHVWFSMFRLNHMILLFTISTHIYITKVIMINIHHIAKDSFKPTQGIATKHFYPKHLFNKPKEREHKSTRNIGSFGWSQTRASYVLDVFWFNKYVHRSFQRNTLFTIDQVIFVLKRPCKSSPILFINIQVWFMQIKHLIQKKHAKASRCLSLYSELF
jgi:hypothetical protein